MLRNLFLIGYRGTGKTRVAQLLADAIGCTWVDVDQQLEAKYAKSICDIFAQEGEEGFRAKEALLIAGLAGGEPRVIATGGGVVLRAENRAIMRAVGQIVWLHADAETIWQRLQRDPATLASRPPLTSLGGLEEIRELLAVRTPLYRECADLAVDTSCRSPEDVVQEIIRLMDPS